MALVPVLLVLVALVLVALVLVALVLVALVLSGASVAFRLLSHLLRMLRITVSSVLHIATLLAAAA